MSINDSSDSKLDIDMASALPKPDGLFDRLIQFSIKNAIWVMLFIIAWIGVGIYGYQKLPIDAVPDITNTQVQINTQATGFTSLEVEQRITYPIENAMAGLPKLEQTRSISRMVYHKSPLFLKMVRIFTGQDSRLISVCKKRKPSCPKVLHQLCHLYRQV